MDKYLSAAKALYAHNCTLTGSKIPWDDIKQSSRELYRKRAKVCIAAYESDISQ